MDTYTPGSSKAPYYYIEEKNNIIFNKGDYDQILFLVNKSHTRMFKRIQHRLKKILDITDLKCGEIMNIDAEKSIAIIPSILREKIHLEATQKNYQYHNCIRYNKKL